MEKPRVGKDEKLEHILKHASRLFGRGSYASTSIRDIAREAEISLAGLYYHFKSKEEVLFTIQQDTFGHVIETAREKIGGVDDPREKLARLIENHVTFFVDNMDAMKVLSHESDTLNGEFQERIAAMKREYFKILVSIIEQIVGPESDARTLAMSLFGMMNWIYNWYNPEHDPAGEELARRMTDLFLRGIEPAAS